LLLPSLSFATQPNIKCESNGVQTVTQPGDRWSIMIAFQYKPGRWQLEDILGNSWKTGVQAQEFCAIKVTIFLHQLSVIVVQLLLVLFKNVYELLGYKRSTLVTGLYIFRKKNPPIMQLKVGPTDPRTGFSEMPPTIKSTSAQLE